jgi:hypothetical protein
VRPGDHQKRGPEFPNGFDGDAISINASKVILDHVSASWGIDENLSVAGRGFKEVTVQYATISEALHQTGLYHGEYNPNYAPGGSKGHSMGSLIKPTSGNGVATFHHNLWSNNGNRNPAVGTYDSDQTLKIDIRNNVIYNNRNNGYSSGKSERVEMNYVGNYIVAGRETRSRRTAFESNANNNVRIYQRDNLLDSDRDVILNGQDYGWQSFSGDYEKATAPLSMARVSTETAEDAYASVIAEAGALPWNRDSVDQRLIAEIGQRLGRVINSQDQVGGYPVLPVVSRGVSWDTDQDGMPDFWEAMVPGLDRLVPDQNGDLNGDGYTNLEEYLHRAATAPIPGPSIPEPSTLLVFLSGCSLLCGARIAVVRPR